MRIVTFALVAQRLSEMAAQLADLLQFMLEQMESNDGRLDTLEQALVPVLRLEQELRQVSPKHPLLVRLDRRPSHKTAWPRTLVRIGTRRLARTRRTESRQRHRLKENLQEHIRALRKSQAMLAAVAPVPGDMASDHFLAALLNGLKALLHPEATAQAVQQGYEAARAAAESSGETSALVAPLVVEQVGHIARGLGDLLVGVATCAFLADDSALLYSGEVFARTHRLDRLLRPSPEEVVRVAIDPAFARCAAQADEAAWDAVEETLG